LMPQLRLEFEHRLGTGAERTVIQEYRARR
jgi:hypothetical protein